jgi:hypothetical protein
MKRNNNKYNNNKNKKMKKFNNNLSKKLTNFRVMRATVTTTFELSSQGYTEQNVQFNYVDALVNNELFQRLSQLYQFYKLSFVETIITPIVYQGTNPPIGYIYFQGNESNIQYAQIPNLPGSKKLSPYKVTYFKFTRPGRNSDFNFWYDTRESEPLQQMQAKLRFRFIVAWQGLPEELGYHVRVKYHMKFSHVCLFSDSNKTNDNYKEKVQIVGNIMNEDGTLEGKPNSNPEDILTKYEKLENELSQ